MRQKGIEGEKIAYSYLLRKGHRIIAKNFHSRFGEIDIISLDGKTIVFTEVKMRSSKRFGTPLEAITYRKLQKLQKTALFFLNLYKLSNSPYRFDAVEIEIVEGKIEINQVENITL